MGAYENAMWEMCHQGKSEEADCKQFYFCLRHPDAWACRFPTPKDAFWELWDVLWLRWDLRVDRVRTWIRWNL